MDTTSTATVAEAPLSEFSTVVKLSVSHGQYRADFYGYGDTILAAAEDAAGQSSYSQDLFDRSDRMYEDRLNYRLALDDALERGEVYRGFGWCDFSLIAKG